MTKKIINICFITLELIIYILFLFFSKGKITAYLQYSSLILLFIWLIIVSKKDIDSYVVLFAFIFTLIADFFLVICNDHYHLALVFFNIVQIAYAFRIYSIKQNKKTFLLYITLALVLLITAKIITKSKFDLLVFLTMVYFANLLTNFYLTFFLKPKNWLFTFGLLFFIFCDVIVGFYSFSAYIEVTQDSLIYFIAHNPINLAWLMYLPSQILIGFSVKQKGLLYN